MIIAEIVNPMIEDIYIYLNFFSSCCFVDG